MGQKPRLRSEIDIYHVIARGAGKQVIFENDHDRRYFMRLLTTLLKSEKYGASAIAWCLMENHFHLLFKIPFESLPGFMQTLQAAYAHYFNDVHEREDHLFQARYTSVPVNTEEYLLSVVRYIHRNPVKAGLVPSCDYPWSSYQSYLAGRGNTHSLKVLEMLNGIESFIRFHEIDEDLKEKEDSRLPSRFNDESALRIVLDIYGDGGVGEIKSLPKARRDRELANLKRRGLSVRQIQRLTGISASTISRAKE